MAFWRGQGLAEYMFRVLRRYQLQIFCFIILSILLTVFTWRCMQNRSDYNLRVRGKIWENTNDSKRPLKQKK